MRVIKNKSIIDDEWSLKREIGNTDPIPSGNVILPFPFWQANRDELINKGFQVIYHSIDDDTFTVPFLDILDQEIQNNKISQIHYFEIIDKTFKNKFDLFRKPLPVEFIEHTSPMFLFKK